MKHAWANGRRYSADSPMNENSIVISGTTDLIISREADVRLTTGFLCWVSPYPLLRVRPVPTHASGSAARDACRLRGVVHGYISNYDAETAAPTVLIFGKYVIRNVFGPVI